MGPMIRKRRPTTRSLVPPTVRREAARRRKSAPQAASAVPIPPATASVEARAEALVAQLRSLGNEENRSGMARFGIRVERAFGVPVTELRRLAKAVGRDHALARALWASGHHEARLLSCFVEDPALVTPRQMEAWVGEIDSWDLCDQAATSLFDLTDHAWSKAAAWAERSEEFTKRAGFALMAGLAV